MSRQPNERFRAPVPCEAESLLLLVGLFQRYRGRPSILSAMMLRLISAVPPPIV